MGNEKFIKWLDNNGGGQASSYTFEDNPFKYEVISKSKVQPGDILVYSGHVEIYAGKQGSSIKVYNAGSTGAIQTDGVTNSSRGLGKTTIILRAN